MKWLLLFLLLVTGPVLAQEAYYYKNRNYGSEALYNPVAVILNGSYDILQIDGKRRDILELPYEQGFKNVFRNLLAPLPAINKLGWKKFIGNEIFPMTLNTKGAQWWPNYQLHLVGGGMTYRMLSEWYAAHGFAYPKTSAGVTTAVYHLLNEAVENENYSGENTDPIADIYIFDIGSIILFSSDAVAEFFATKLELADWSSQPAFCFPDKTLQNNGQYFSIKWKTPLSDNVKFFHYFGMNGLTGISVPVNNEHSLSFAAGLRAKNLITVDAAARHNSLELVWNAAVFWDKNNSLMASLSLSGLTHSLLAVNIYPGVVNIGGFSPGLWLNVSQKGKLSFGTSVFFSPGVGFSKMY